MIMVYTYQDASGQTHVRVISVPSYDTRARSAAMLSAAKRVQGAPAVSLVKSVPASYSAESARYVAGAYRRVELSCAFCSCGQDHYIAESNYPLIMRG